MTDLSQTPDAPRARPSTTSYGGTFTGQGQGISVNQWDSRKRKAEIAIQQQPDAYDLSVAKHRAAQTAEQAKQEQQAAAQQARAQQQTEEQARRQKIADFRVRDRLVTAMLTESALTQDERQQVMTRLGKTTGGTTNLDLCSIAVQEILLNRAK
jgi:hypothetical protein